MFDRFMLSECFIRSENDYCLYFRILDSCKIFLIYVEDLVIAGSDIEQVNDF